MKKIGTVILILSICRILSAQQSTEDSKRPMVLGGSVNFLIQNNTFPLGLPFIRTASGGVYSNSVNDRKYTTFSILPYIGKTLNPQWLIGLELDYRKETYASEEEVIILSQPRLINYTRNSHQTGLGLFARYTLMPAQPFNIFIQPAINYYRGKEIQKTSGEVDGEERTTYINIGLTAGLLYNISQSIRATLRFGGLNYINGHWKQLDTGKEKDFSSLGLNFNLSTVYFGLEMKF